MDKIRDLREKYFQIDDEYLNGYAKLCGINATGVYLSMCRHANKTQQCFPSKKLISEELAISERSVYSAIKELEKWGIIKIDDQGRKKDGSFRVKVYTLLDKKHWKIKPQANCAVGKKRQSPQAPVAEEGNTYMKETHTSFYKKKFPPILDYWNSLVIPTDRAKKSGFRNSNANDRLLRRCRKITTDIEEAFCRLKYSEDEIKLAIRNYAIDILGRDPNNDYSNHRFSLYEFLKQQNGLKKYINK